MEIISHSCESTSSLGRKRRDGCGQKVPQPRRSKLSFKQYWRELFEAVFTLGCVLILGMILPSTWLQSHLAFCIFFLFVFVIAVRRCALTIYAVGFFVAVYYAFLLWQYSQVEIKHDGFVIFIEPFLLFVSGIIIGEMLRIQRHQLATLKQQQCEKEVSLEEVKQRYQDTQTINAKLEQRLVGQSLAVSAVSEKMAGLWALHGQQRYDAIVDLVMHATNANFCALYMSYNGHMTLCTSQRRDAYEHEKAVDLELDLNDPLISRAMCDRRVCTVHDVLAGSQSTRRLVGMMAGLFVDQHNEILGVVVVDDIPLLTFLPSTAQLFESLLHVMQPVVQAEVSSKKEKRQFISFSRPILSKKKNSSSSLLLK
jgi:hypothetical protein